MRMHHPPQPLNPLLRTRIDALRKLHGTYKAAGEAIGLSGPYLWRIRNGEHNTLSDETMKKLGVKRLSPSYVLDLDD